jgi:Fe2+ transport system protein FeoA
MIDRLLPGRQRHEKHGSHKNVKQTSEQSQEGELSFSLSKGEEDRSYRVISVSGGHNVKSRLSSMGILPGQIIRILQNGLWGPVMIGVKGSKVALGRTVSSKIVIKPHDLN